MDIQLSIDILLLLFLVALTAGFIDTLAGGGGLITVPALLLTGMPPLSALGFKALLSLSRNALRWVIVFACIAMLGKYVWQQFF